MVRTELSGPVLIRVPPYIEYHTNIVGAHGNAVTTKLLCEHIKPLRKKNTHNHYVNLIQIPVMYI